MFSLRESRCSHKTFISLLEKICMTYDLCPANKKYMMSTKIRHWVMWESSSVKQANCSSTGLTFHSYQTMLLFSSMSEAKLQYSSCWDRSFSLSVVCCTQQKLTNMPSWDTKLSWAQLNHQFSGFSAGDSDAFSTTHICMFKLTICFVCWLKSNHLTIKSEHYQINAY